MSVSRERGVNFGVRRPHVARTERFFERCLRPLPRSRRRRWNSSDAQARGEQAEQHPPVLGAAVRAAWARRLDDRFVFGFGSALSAGRLRRRRRSQARRCAGSVGAAPVQACPRPAWRARRPAASPVRRCALRAGAWLRRVRASSCCTRVCRSPRCRCRRGRGRRPAPPAAVVAVVVDGAAVPCSGVHQAQRLAGLRWTLPCRRCRAVAPGIVLARDFGRRFARRDRRDLARVRNAQRAAGTQHVDVAVEGLRIVLEDRHHRAVHVRARTRVRRAGDLPQRVVRCDAVGAARLDARRPARCDSRLATTGATVFGRRFGRPVPRRGRWWRRPN